MQITVYSFFTAVFWTSILSVILYAIRKHPAFIKRFGIFSVGLIYLFCVGRMLFPLELVFTKEIPVAFLFNPLTTGLQSQVMNFEGYPITLFSILVFAWLAVSAILLIRFIADYIMSRKFYKYIEKSYDIELRNMLEKIQKNTGRLLNINVSYAENINTPVSIGILEKQIILPRRSYTDEELYFILTHEYTHFVNHDLAVTMMIHLFSYVFWWNPTVYLLKKDLEQVLEIKCDLSVVSQMDVLEKAQYLNLILLHKKDFKKKILPLPAGKLSFLGHKSESCSEERFRYIQQSSVRTSCPVMQSCFLALAVFLFGVSYCFVFQSQFEAPMEEIETTSDTYAIEDHELTIRKKADGRYELIDPHGSTEIDEEIALMLIDQGIKFILE